MGIGITCDECGEAVTAFTLPAKFKDETKGFVIQISVIRGKASLDFCKRCFCNLLLSLASISAPQGFSYHEKNEQLVEK